jgi:hypothetical protein
MTSWSKILTVSFLLLFLLPFPILLGNATSGNVVTSPLTEAEDTLTSTYEVVLEAEEAGANVSNLLDELNLGAEYLAEAYIYHRLGIAENANRFADLSISVVEGIRSEALELRDEAKIAEENESAMNMFGSTVGVVVVVVFFFIFWQLFKRRYYRRILKSSPEVVSGES